jgi:hypothetical protein
MPVDFSNAFVLRHLELLGDNFRTKDLKPMPALLGIKSIRKIYAILSKHLAKTTYYWTPRALCVFEGQVARSVCGDIWIKNVISGIKAGKEEKIVISDCRFPNEIDLIKESLSGEEILSVRVNRHEKSPTKNATESALDKYKFDKVVENKGSLSEYQLKVMKIAAEE